MEPEKRARKRIDAMLSDAGWAVQGYARINLGAASGVAVREFPLPAGAADYMLFVDREAVGVVEAKPEGTTLSGVAEQSGKYITNVPATVPHVQLPLPFAYESTGAETMFRDTRAPEPRSRRLFSFHQPVTLRELLADDSTLRARLTALPSLVTDGLRTCQVEAVTSLEKSFAHDRPRALIQMATGTGKTYTAVTFSYRLIKFANARRILFLVDRSNLGRQTLREFQQYVTPDDGRKFTELYNVQHLTSNTLDPVARVCIATIQRVYAMLRGEELDPDLEEQSGFEAAELPQSPRDVVYNPQFPLEYFDVIVTDECHRSIYNLWRQVLEYFDAYLIGLTATPSKQTLGFFNQNLVTEYSRERAVADGVNVDYDVYRIRTQITEQGSTVEAGQFVDRRRKADRKTRWEQLDQDLEYAATQLDRDVVAIDQIRTVIRTFRDKLFTEIFPGRTEVPKTLVFAKNDSHAEDIVQVIREEFGKGNDFCTKITYRTTGAKPEDLIASFRNSYSPRIAVTVDMISTGTDIKPLECLLFMRDVKSRVYFEQMKGRGGRTIGATDLKAVTPDCPHKTHFVIVDAVGVCESAKPDSPPLERKPSVPFDKLIHSVALGNRDEATLTSLAGRLARLDRQLEPAQQQQLARAAGGTSLRDVTNRLLDAVDPDKQVEHAQVVFATEQPTEQQIAQATAELANAACKPFDAPAYRELLCEVRRQQEQTIDTVSSDELLDAEFDVGAREKAETLVTSFRQFIEDNRDEITALQILYSRPYGQKQLTYATVRELADALSKPPLSLNPELLWHAYEQLTPERVRRLGPQKLLTNLISLVRFAIDQQERLEPFPLTVEERFEQWLAGQQQQGRTFTTEQQQWLGMIRDHIAANIEIDLDDFNYAPFFEKGGVMRATKVFGQDLTPILNELTEVLVA